MQSCNRIANQVTATEFQWLHALIQMTNKNKRQPTDVKPIKYRFYCLVTKNSVSGHYRWSNMVYESYNVMIKHALYDYSLRKLQGYYFICQWLKAQNYWLNNKYWIRPRKRQCNVLNSLWMYYVLHNRSGKRLRIFGTKSCN